MAGVCGEHGQPHPSGRGRYPGPGSLIPYRDVPAVDNDVDGHKVQAHHPKLTPVSLINGGHADGDLGQEFISNAVDVGDVLGVLR